MPSRLLAAALLSLLPAMAMAQDTPTPPSATTAPAPQPLSEFDATYTPSPSVSARLQREFLERVGLSAGPIARSKLAASFGTRSAMDIWAELVAEDGLKPNDVADALTSYWILNWVTANGAYTAHLDNEPVRRQLRLALANDAKFAQLTDMQKQTLAEDYVLEFLLLHRTLNEAVANKDVPVLNALAAASVQRFRQEMGVDLLSLKPGADGFEPREAPAAAD